jgi:hypothetical protein
MPSRHPGPGDAGYSRDYISGTTTLDPEVLNDPAFAFTAQLHVPHARRYWADSNEGRKLSGLIAYDGSWSEVHGKPDCTAFSFEATPTRQVVRFADQSWELAG